MKTIQETNNPNTKVCSMCKQEMHVVNFYKDIRSSDGLHSMCKACKNRHQIIDRPVKKIETIIQRKKKIKKDTQNAMLNVRMSDSLKKKLKVVSMIKGCSVGTMVRDVIEVWVNGELGL